VSVFRMALRSAHIAALRRGPKTNDFFRKHEDVNSDVDLLLIENKSRLLVN
jgi:hypothetical protein